MNPNNVNTGRSGFSNDFQWFKPSSTAHVEAVITSAPDFSIPPTPASSYSNLHVVLDSIHSSYQTTTTGIVAPSVRSQAIPSSAPLISTSNVMNVPITSSTVSRDVPFESNKIPDIKDSFRAVPDRVNPEQPGARSNEALTSLKSEVAPLVPRLVELEDIEEPEEPIRIRDDLAERTDRDLPESVDISLVDESFDQYNKWSKISWDISNKKWNLKHWTAPSHLNKWQDSERQWRSIRTIDPMWSGRMHLVGKELLATNIALLGWSHWLSGLKNKAVAQSRDMVDAAVDAKDSAVDKASDLLESASELKDAAIDKAIELKDAAMEKASDLLSTASDMKDSLKDSLLTKTAAPVVLVTDAKITSSPVPRFFTTSASVAYSAAEPIDFTFWSRRTPTDIIEMEETEREDRIARGVNPILSAKWRQLGLEIAAHSKAGSLLWSEWLNGIKNKFSYKSHRLMNAAANNSLYAAQKSMDAVESAAEMSSDALGYAANKSMDIAHKSIDAAESVAEMSSDVLGYAAQKSMDALGYAAQKSRDLLVDAAQGAELLADSAAAKSIDLMDSAVDSLNKMDSFRAPSSLLVPRGAEYYYAPIDFTFKARRLPFAIRNLEEQERALRMRSGVSPIILGLWFRLGQELKWKLSLKPTLGYAAKEVVGSAIEKSEEMLGNLSSYVMEKGQDLIDLAAVATTPVERVDFAQHGDLPLNFFSFTAEPVDFTFKKNRTPASIIALEEKERRDRINAGANPLTYARWSKLLDTPRTTLRVVNPVATFALPSLESAKDTLIESTGNAIGKAESIAEDVVEKGKSWTGYFGSLASGMINAASHSQIVEAAKEKIGFYDAGSVHSINKLEEAERLRRMNEKIDPMMMARLTRVQDELLHSIKSV